MSANSLGGAAGTGFDNESLLHIGTVSSSASDGLGLRAVIVAPPGCGLGDTATCANGGFALFGVRDGLISCGFRGDIIKILFRKFMGQMTRFTHCEQDL